ncbi:ATP-binding protein [Rhodalgimonas zhirmunskyi]|uniref:histidine kinase n=1 Tax=Rhodalgimonas zhirmunskyi TaxID=2964767 RepID=A0AAJ1UAM3_9RHOB|nr:ATP-binding protein [Rhodoalgimonas zhirmunskyi]MDQ2094935.1 ATP-binding protein [Rhodoalgimonas zhirmunskyi]
MTDAFSTRRKGRFSFLRPGHALLGAIGFLCAFAIAFLISEIVEELRYLNSASSDNVHWVLSQAEVEFLEFSNAVETARREPNEAALNHVIVEFDVFYSRMVTLGTGLLYADLRKIDAFGGSVAEIRRKLGAMVPVIDGPKVQLRSELGTLANEAREIRPLLRTVATRGLQFFAERSDQSRDSVAYTLLRLAAITVALVLALVVVLIYNRRVSRQTEKRGEELADAYTRLNTILQTSLDAVVVSDLEGRILNFNPAAERIFQRSYADVIGKDLAEVIIPDHFREAHYAGMKRMKATGKHKVVGHGRIRLEAMRANGEVFPVEMALEKAQTGEDEMVVGFLRDISHRVASETELVEARDRALAGEKAKAEFLAMMTHEIRTPLNGLLGNLALMKKTQLSPAQNRYVRNMGISGGVLMHHVDAVLDVARFESGASVTREEDVHIGRLVQDIVDSQASAAEANGNHIQWGWIGEPLEWIRIDASRLRQVLLNLVGNAIKFTHDGRILIEVEQTEGLQKDDRTCGLDIRVIDSGVGISEADQDRVFNDFQTVDQSRIEGQAGTGLGLGIARRFIEAMEGEIGCESTPGEGSVFWLHVPVAPVARPEERISQAPKTAPVASLDILLVEDNEINLELAREMLTGLGHRVTEARDGEQAVATAQARLFDLILMDIRMPRLDGLGATRAIRSGDGASRAVPIIAFSANVLPEAKDRFTAAGMSGFLPKPLSETELQQVIARFCGADQSQQEASPSDRNVDPMAHLRTRYLDETRDLFNWLARLPSDLGEIADRAHKIAGSAAAFGQPDLRDALIELEMAAESGHLDRVEDAIHGAREAWESAPEPTLG